MQHIQDKITAALKDAHVVDTPYEHLINSSNPTLATLAKSYRDWYVTGELCEEIEHDRSEFRKREKQYLLQVVQQSHDTLHAFALTMKTIDPTIEEYPDYNDNLPSCDHILKYNVQLNEYECSKCGHIQHDAPLIGPKSPKRQTPVAGLPGMYYDDGLESEFA